MDQNYIYHLPSEGEVVLMLRDACIQSTAKRALRLITDGLITDRFAGARYETAVEILKQFLESNDFGRLRARHPELRGEFEQPVRVYFAADKTVHWQLVQKE
ncbi:MAG: hypothetical protein JXA30_01390 [Deltaproteobacteria bacterium]|nr:hypothetical protein [Deltaproteobacteria bacterium]